MTLLVEPVCCGRAIPNIYAESIGGTCFPHWDPLPALGGVRYKTKTFCGGDMDIFWEYTIRNFALYVISLKIVPCSNKLPLEKEIFALIRGSSSCKRGSISTYQLGLRVQIHSKWMWTKGTNPRGSNSAVTPAKKN